MLVTVNAASVRLVRNPYNREMPVQVKNEGAAAVNLLGIDLTDPTNPVVETQANGWPLAAGATIALVLPPHEDLIAGVASGSQSVRYFAL